MDTRKDYVAPAIAAEDTLEQTSLACNVTETGPGTLEETCDLNVAKGGAFYVELCTVVVETPVALS